MKQVKIYKLQDDGSQKEIAICNLVDGKVICDGDDKFVKQIFKIGITNYSDKNNKKLYPSNGEKFLEQLKYNFSSGYYNASNILEVN